MDRRQPWEHMGILKKGDREGMVYYSLPQLHSKAQRACKELCFYGQPGLAFAY